MKKGVLIALKLGDCWFGSTYTARKLSSGIWSPLILKITDLNEVKMNSLPERALMVRSLPKESMAVPIWESLKILGQAILLQPMHLFNLRTYLQTYQISLEKKAIVAIRLIEALASAHQAGYAHGRVTANNILFIEELQPYLTDWSFGGYSKLKDALDLGKLLFYLYEGQEVHDDEHPDFSEATLDFMKRII